MADSGGGARTENQKPIPDQIKDVVQKWDDKSPQCAFKHYFYNKVEEAAIPYYAPQPHEDPREWEEALQNKPAAGFMPVLAAGFAGMAERLKVQQRAIGTFNAKLHEINRSLDTILEDHDLKTSVRSLAARRRHAQLARRCLSLAAKTQVLRNRGYALSGDEDDLLTKLRAVEKGIQDPALGARMDDLWGRLIALRSYADNLKAEISRRGIKEAEGLGGDIEAKAKKVRGLSPWDPAGADRVADRRGLRETAAASQEGGRGRQGGSERLGEGPEPEPLGKVASGSRDRSRADGSLMGSAYHAVGSGDEFKAAWAPH